MGGGREVRHPAELRRILWGGSEVLVVSYGFDSYNQAVEQEVAQPIRAHGGGDETPKVVILNPTDSQGNQIADSNGVYPTLRACGGAGYQSGYVFDRGQPNEEDPTSIRCPKTP